MALFVKALFYEDNELYVKFEMSEPYGVFPNIKNIKTDLTDWRIDTQSQSTVPESQTNPSVTVNIMTTPAVYMNTKLKSV